ncbi:MAG: hypothetical protein K0S12_1511, partial [Bacteroidetes bacterium]|nr:hypothetical protein [Bacteroidota bacterium]
MLSYFFYYYVVIEFNYNIEQLFKWYLTGAYIAALLGVFQIISFKLNFIAGYRFGFILNKWSFSPGGFLGFRVNSIFAEPTHLAAVLSAAFFVSVYNLFRKETFHLSRFQSAVIVGIYGLSFSGLGQTGIFLTLVFLAVSFGLVRYIIVAIPAAIMLFYFLYNEVPEFKQRYDGLVGLFSGQKFKLGETHGSSFILYNNYKVAMKNFESNFVFGSGIGSHPVAFEKYSLAKDIKTGGFSNNSADANSMLLRIISETGLFGLCIFLYIIFRCYVRKVPEEDSNHWLISNGILIMILLNLFRQGHYFLNGFPFFVIMYYFNHRSYMAYVEERETADSEELIVAEEQQS